MVIEWQAHDLCPLERTQANAGQLRRKRELCSHVLQPGNDERCQLQDTNAVRLRGDGAQDLQVHLHKMVMVITLKTNQVKNYKKNNIYFVNILIVI